MFDIGRKLAILISLRNNCPIFLPMSCKSIRSGFFISDYFNYNSQPTYLSGDLFEQVLFVFIDFVAFAVRAHQDFLVQFMDVGNICIGHLLNDFDNVWKFGPQNFINLNTERN